MCNYKAQFRKGISIVSVSVRGPCGFACSITPVMNRVNVFKWSPCARNRRHIPTASSFAVSIIKQASVSQMEVSIPSIKEHIVLSITSAGLFRHLQHSFGVLLDLMASISMKPFLPTLLPKVGVLLLYVKRLKVPRLAPGPG